MLPRILAVDSSRWTTLARLPAYLRGTASLDVLTPPRHPVRWSRFVDRRFLLEGDPAEGLRRHLENFGPYGTVLVADDPLLLRLISLAKTELWAARCLPAFREQLSCAVDKTRFPALCESLGLAVPDWRLLETPHDLSRALVELPGPWVLKAPEGFSGLALRKVDRPAEAAPALASLGHPPRSLLQRWIEGRVGDTAFVARHGELLACVSAYKVLSYGGPLGASCARAFAEPAGVREAVDRLVRVLSYHGFGGLGWIEEASTGKVMLLELNARAISFHHLGSRAGENRRAVASAFSGGPFPPPLSSIRPRYPTVYMFPQHLQRCIQECEPAGLLRWLPGAATTDFPWDDPLVGLAHFRSLAGFAARKLKQSLRSVRGA